MEPFRLCQRAQGVNYVFDLACKHLIPHANQIVVRATCEFRTQSSRKRELTVLGGDCLRPGVGTEGDGGHGNASIADRSMGWANRCSDFSFNTGRGTIKQRQVYKSMQDGKFHLPGFQSDSRSNETMS